MCMMAIGIVANLAGTVMQAAGAAAAADAKSKRADYMAKQERNQARDAALRGSVEENAKRREASALQARQKAVMSASGLDVTSGSPLDVLADTAMLGELDAQTIRNNAQRQTNAHTNQATLHDMESDAAQTEGRYAVAGALLGGVSSVASKWTQAGKQFS